MKKLLIAAIALTAVCASQAGYVDWQKKLTGAATADVPGYTAYLVPKAAWEALTSGEDLKDQAAIAGVAVDSTTFMANGSAGKGTNKTYNSSTKTESGNAAPRAVDVGSGSTYDAYIVLFDASANGGKGGYQAELKSMSIRGETDVPNTSGVASATLASVSGGTWNQFSGSTPIPEPTSVALIALGLAALGLKRKVA